MEINIIGIIKKYKYIIAVIIVGIFFMSIPDVSDNKSSTLTANEINFDVKDFEARIEKILIECEGVGRVKVILSVDSGPEFVYAKDSKKSQRAQQEGVVESDSDVKPTIMSEGSGKESPIKIKEMYPKFRGALVVCDGAEDAAVKRIVVDSIMSLTGLKSDSISVIKMKMPGGK